jgi:hypothetical protein
MPAVCIFSASPFAFARAVRCLIVLVRTAPFVSTRWRRMTVDDLNRIAEYHAEMVNPGRWPDMTDRQKAVQLRNVAQVITAALMCGHLLRKSPVKVTVE